MELQNPTKYSVMIPFLTPLIWAFVITNITLVMCEGTRYTPHMRLVFWDISSADPRRRRLCAKCTDETWYSGLYCGVANKNEKLNDAPMPYSKWGASQLHFESLLKTLVPPLSKTGRPKCQCSRKIWPCSVVLRARRVNINWLQFVMRVWHMCAVQCICRLHSNSRFVI